MKKVLSVLFVATLFAGGIFMQSCNKCSTCTYTYDLPGGQTETFTYAEVCGNSGDVEDYKDACADAAAILTNGNCTCVDD